MDDQWLAKTLREANRSANGHPASSFSQGHLGDWRLGGHFLQRQKKLKLPAILVLDSFTKNATKSALSLV